MGTLTAFRLHADDYFEAVTSEVGLAAAHRDA